jgi:hypothetical protein
VIVAVPISLITVVAGIYILSIAGIAVSRIVIETRLIFILIRLALVAVKELMLTAPLLYDIFNAGFAATHTKVLLEGHSNYHL